MGFYRANIMFPTMVSITNKLKNFNKVMSSEKSRKERTGSSAVGGTGAFVAQGLKYDSD